jgi:chromosomal replication initiator protein
MSQLPRIAEIQKTVAKRYRVPLGSMTAPGTKGGRQRKHAWPRQVAITLAVRLTNHSYVRIGQLFGGRDHSTILYACQAVEKRRAKNPKLHNSIRRLTLELVGQTNA